MAVAAWQPGTLYLPGSLVAPVSSAASTSTAIPNADFELGDVDWAKGVGWSIGMEQPFGGSFAAKYVGPGVANIVSSTKHPVTPGKSITAQCMIQHGASAAGQANGAVILQWYDATSALISTSTGNVVSDGASGVYKQSAVTGIAPPLATQVAIGATANNNWSPLYVDNLSWNYVTGSASGGLAFKAIQAAAGLSGLIEPAWPITAGLTVVDNAVTWEAVTSGSVTWEASSVLTSGGAEPVWPLEAGAFISDNNIAWETVPLRITDEHNPRTKVVAIAASKVFAGDDDIVRFCATLNARDWTTQEDAGFIPTGLQQKSQTGVSAMGVYRGNLVVWSPSTFQMWQVDPDPSAMALLDAMEGIGSVHQQAVQAVSDDLFFLAALGVRTVAIAEGTNNLASGDAGVPIDTLIQAEVVPDVEPVATYYPGAGQYWLAFRLLSIPLLAFGSFLITSTIYPVEVTEQVTWSSQVTGGSWQSVPADGARFSASALNSELDDVLLSTEVVDGARFSASAMNGELDDVLLSTGTQMDGARFSASALDGTLELSLVSHENPPESMDWSAQVTGGTST